MFWQQIEPYDVCDEHLNVQLESKRTSSGSLSVLNENTVKMNLGRLSVSDNITKPTVGRLPFSQNSDSLVKEIKSVARLSTQNSDPVKELKSLGCK